MVKYRLEDPAVQMLAKIVHGAEVSQDLYGQPEAPGLEAIAEGFRHLGLKDDREILAKEFIVYDALYAYCQRKVSQSYVGSETDGTHSRAHPRGGRGD